MSAQKAQEANRIEAAERTVLNGLAAGLDSGRAFRPKDGLNTPSQDVPMPLALHRPGASRQICRQGRVAIYSGPGRNEFEVVVIRVEKARLIKGIPYPDREIYPSPEEWGTYGWSYTENSHPNALSAARARMRACLEFPGQDVGTIEPGDFGYQRAGQAQAATQVNDREYPTK